MKKLKILITDDHAIVRKGLIQLLLEEYPFAAFGEANSAEELVKKIMTDSWDLVICDINMPGRTGIDVIKQLKQITPDTPILIMSMYPEDQYALRAFKAGASGYLSKDSIHRDLFHAIERVLAGKKFITPSIAEKLAESISEDSQKPAHEKLSNREFEVFILLASGKPTTEIAKKLSLSHTTISTYRMRILEKMKMKSNAELIMYVMERKLI